MRCEGNEVETRRHQRRGDILIEKNIVISERKRMKGERERRSMESKVGV